MAENITQQTQIDLNLNNSTYFQLDNDGQMNFTQQDISQVINNLSDTILKYAEPEFMDYVNQQQQQDHVSSRRDSRSLLNPSTLSKKKPQLFPLQGQPTVHQTLSISDVLDSMFPPKIFQKDNYVYKQRVLSDEISRAELLQLEFELDTKLKARKARNRGICQIREDLHNQLFDEIIRQCTINCPERGMLLLRVRDQIKMTFAAYQTLYQGSVVFANKKQVQAEKGIKEMEDEREKLQKHRVYLENQRIQLENEFECLQKSFQEINSIEQKKKQKEIQFLEQTNSNLENILQNIQQAL